MNDALLLRVFSSGSKIKPKYITVENGDIVVLIVNNPCNVLCFNLGVGC
jgi:hypothetical protein